MLNTQAQSLRSWVYGRLSALPAVPAPVLEDLFVSGVPVNQKPIGFTHHWFVHGDATRGLEASVRDYEDVIEFGLLERDGESAIPVLHAILVLEDGDSELNCMSEPTPSLNFDEYVTLEKRDGLDRALDQFASILAGDEVTISASGG